MARNPVQCADTSPSRVLRQGDNSPFEDPFALIELDESEEYGEDRFLLTGRAAGGILVVVYTERGERVRIISAREATEYERRNYYRAAQED